MIVQDNKWTLTHVDQIPRVIDPQFVYIYINVYKYEYYVYLYTFINKSK